VSQLRVVVEADGGARGNPGPAGWGALVREAETGEVLLERSEAIGTATNNVAEYGGLIAGLQAAADLGASAVEVRMDSKLVIEQMTGRWRIRHPGLRPLAAQAAALVRRFDSVTWSWVPRERNKEADRLANEAMDAAARRATGGDGARTPSTPTRPAAGTGPAGTGPAGTAAAARRAGPASPAGAAGRAGWDPPTAPPTRLLLVRHGETTLNAEHRYSGRRDVPLSDRGRDQAAAVARRVAGLAPRVAAVVSSPLGRCTATAAAVAAAVGDPPVVTEPDLVEYDFGEWEGLTLAEVRDRWPAELDAWLASTSVALPGGESLQQVAKRVRRVVATLRESYPEAAVVVVSHVWPLKLMLRDALAAGDAFLHRLWLTPAGLSVVDSYPDGTVTVHTVNDTAHLSPTP
jgi:probable phosphoglycerate mutase